MTSPAADGQGALVLTLHNWNENPPMPFTLTVRRRLLHSTFELSTGDRVVGSGWNFRHAEARRRGQALLAYAVKV